MLEDGEVDSLEVDYLLGVARSWSLDPSVVASTSERVIGDAELSPDVRHRLGVVERALRSVS